MPYKIEKQSGNFCVVKADDKSVVKCHPTMGAAQAHMQALYANVPDAGGKEKTDEDDEMSKSDKARARQRKRELETRRVKDLSDLETAFKGAGTMPRAEWVGAESNDLSDLESAFAKENAAMGGLLVKRAPNHHKAITDAPNLRGDDWQQCQNCKYYQALPSKQKKDDFGNSMVGDEPDDSDTGICTQYEFETDHEWVCDSYETVTPPAVEPLPVTIVEPVKEAIPVFDEAIETAKKIESPALSAIDVERIARETMLRVIKEAQREPVAPVATPTPAPAVDVSAYQQQIDEALARADKAQAEAETLQLQLDETIAEKQQGIISKVKSLFARKPQAKPAIQPFTLFKDKATGRLRFVAIASNNYRDQDKPPQIITEAAHKEFESYLSTNYAAMPELWHWHIPGSRYGKADTSAYLNGFKLYSGLIDTGMEAVAERITKDNPEMSHGFKVMQYDPSKELINQYRTFEISTLPATRAANRWTSFNVIVKEVTSMAGLPPQKRKDFVEKFGEDFVTKLEAGTTDAKAILDAIGVESKEANPAPVVAEANPEAVKAIEPSLSDVMAAVNKLGESVTAIAAKSKEVDTAIVELQKSKDEEVANLIRPRAAAALTGYSASSAKETTLTQSEKDEQLRNAQPSETARVLAAQVERMLK